MMEAALSPMPCVQPISSLLVGLISLRRSLARYVTSRARDARVLSKPRCSVSQAVYVFQRLMLLPAARAALLAVPNLVPGLVQILQVTTTASHTMHRYLLD